MATVSPGLLSGPQAEVVASTLSASTGTPSAARAPRRLLLRVVDGMIFLIPRCDVPLARLVRSLANHQV
ncbi:hypothetical protein F7Q99_27685 [Streptomyces kaniharaensis]|uniref:Uncharacterized protein n=1 Tax=Streptomyces kaniharaensis TaxID=212423 RepID=A0A6N7L185_9ACTN|nr:hypothetical protein [Streptomyces kaniharaensis]MQS15934.1 hypothetical protein [Streptomyces kaniharaensis]